MRILVAGFVLCALAVPTHAQCVDWSPAFGPSGLGFQNGLVTAFTEHDDGTGIALYASTGTSTTIVRWAGGSWSPVGGSFNSSVDSLLSFDDGSGTQLYAGGGFSTIAGQPALRLARWDGASWSEFGGGTDSQVEALCVFDDGSGPKLYVAGAFTHVGGVAANRIACWNGSGWSALGTGLNQHVYSLAVHDDGSGPALYVGGQFTLAGGSPAFHVARWNSAGWSAVGSGLPTNSGQAVESLLPWNGTLYAGGTFTLVQPHGDVGVASWNGSSWSEVGNVGPRVHELSLFDVGAGAKLHAGGEFLSANGNGSIQRLARWSGSQWEALGAGVCCGGFPGVYALKSWNDGAGDRLFVGGAFTTAGGFPSANIGVWGLPCTAPVITQQPQDTTAQFPDPVVVSVQALGTAPVSYQWRKNGNPLVDGGSVHGSLTPTLSLTAWTFNDAGNYDCQISNGLGSVTSNVAVVTVPAGGTSGHPVPVTQIITYPTPVPNSPGDTYTGLIQACQSSTNEVVFGARLNGSCAGCGESSFNIWQGGAESLLYRPWQQVPGLPNGVSFGIISPTVGEGLVIAGQGGSSIFQSSLLGPGVNIDNDKMLFYRDSGIEVPVVREGDPAPGMPVGATFPTVDGITRMSDDGHVAFFASAYIGAAYQGNGFWCWNVSGGTVPLANTTMAAPGMGSNFSSLTSGITLNATGQAAFLGGYAGDTAYAIFRGVPGSLQAVVATGDPVPNMPNGTFAPGGNIVMNDAGDLAFFCQIVVPGQSNRFAVYTLQQGALTPIALQGDPAPGTGPGANLFVVSPLAVFPSGNVLLYASLTSNNCSVSPCPNAALYLWRQGTLIPVAMNRSFPYPEQPLNFDVDHVETVAVNDAEQVVLQVNFYYGQTYTAVYGWTEDDGLFPIAVPGSQYETTPGQYKTVLSAGLEPLGGGSSGGSGFPPAHSPNLSQAGRVLLRITFTDFTQGYYTGQFSQLQGLYFSPGISFCAGDGTLSTNCPCSNLGGAGRGCANSINPAGARLLSNGAASVSEDALLMVADGELPTALSILLQGNSQSAAGVGFGDGVRCVAGSLKRIGSGNAVGGVFQYPTGAAPSISSRSGALGDPLGVGMTRYYQVYYRDPNLAFCSSPPGSSFNVSNGQRVTWNP